jgi:putative redox protein
LKYKVKGAVNEKKLKRAIDLSESTYCSVSAMLKSSAEITNEFDIIV